MTGPANLRRKWQELSSACLNPPTATHLLILELIDDKPERRRTVRYRGADGRRVIGKLLADPQRARRLYANHLHMWQAGLGVPQPIELAMSEHLVLYLEAPGTPLDELLATAFVGTLASDAGRWLAELQSSAIALDRTFDLANETSNLVSWGHVVDDRVPSGDGRATRLAEHLGNAAALLDMGVGTPIHKDFHAGHILVDGGRFTVIDLDEMRFGDAAFDIGHFLAYLRLAAWRAEERAFDVAGLEQRFIDGYRIAGGTAAMRHVWWAQAYAFLKIGRQLVLGEGAPPRPMGEAMHRQLDLAIEAGEMCVGHASV